MHLEILPIWILPLVAVIVFASIAVLVWARIRTRRAEQRWRERRRKNIAHSRAWDWVMGRRAPRLTDQRSAAE
ncbi:MAG: hypothetical protein EOP60_13695 [Sphingomonadales bacterium]|nr:MAG: hypothetical protein EOP60_13695 [Sphingomonadales bacterium]